MAEFCQIRELFGGISQSFGVLRIQDKGDTLQPEGDGFPTLIHLMCSNTMAIASRRIAGQETTRCKRAYPNVRDIALPTGTSERHTRSGDSGPRGPPDCRSLKMVCRPVTRTSGAMHIATPPSSHTACHSSVSRARITPERLGYRDRSLFLFPHLPPFSFPLAGLIYPRLRIPSCDWAAGGWAAGGACELSEFRFAGRTPYLHLLLCTRCTTLLHAALAAAPCLAHTHGHGIRILGSHSAVRFGGLQY
ncbi:hypothetical protein B0H16DRAFT_1482113 [Mycena metata]|uniref:Uncharacterized protein n=1 Tax=Mycena metata TaxID=1033252 RepID=A0AAD7GUT7_9AGAR|nr:hypothetical protein B0H16DRAFT_1482113 [Mycena metata]